MKQGIISETIENRSVLKYVRQTQEINTSGAEQITDCALFSCHTVTFPVAEYLLMRHAIYAAVNDLFVKGCVAEGIICAITLPERVRESKLKQMMEEAVTICQALSIKIEGQQVLVSDSVNHPVVTVTAWGRNKLANANLSCQCVTGKDMAETVPTYANGTQEMKDICADTDAGQKLQFAGQMAGADIVVTKYIGGQGASLVAFKKEEELLSRFPRTLVKQTQDFSSRKALSVLPEAQIALRHGTVCMLPVNEGGIFAALWDLAKLCRSGLSVELKKIPMKQSIVEVCNFYDLNPYELLSSGCLLFAAKDAEALVAELYEAGIPAAIIGRLTDDNDKIITNGEETRYLDLPKPDQIRQVL